MLDRRRFVRTRTLAAGTIAYGRDRATLDCVVRDLSDGGALLLLDAPMRAPAEMTLATRGGTRPARVVWRGETAVGVAFAAVQADPAAQAPAEPSRSAAVVNLDAVRRARAFGTDERRLAERIARFVRSPGRPGPA